MAEEEVDVGTKPEGYSMYKIKQKLWKFRDAYKIVNVHDESDFFYVKGKIWTLGNDLKMLDKNEKLIRRMKERVWDTFLPKYVILEPKKNPDGTYVDSSLLDMGEENDEEETDEKKKKKAGKDKEKELAKEKHMNVIATVQRLVALNPKFDCYVHPYNAETQEYGDADKKNPIHVKGGILEYDFTFTTGPEKTVVAQVSKHFFKFADYYVVKIGDDQDIPTILSMCIIIDQCCHKD